MTLQYSCATLEHPTSDQYQLVLSLNQEESYYAYVETLCVPFWCSKCYANNPYTNYKHLTVF